MNKFEIKGKIKEMLDAESVGTHTKYAVILTHGPKDSEVAIDFWNDGADALQNFTEGQEVTIQFTIKSRGNKGKWYTNLSGSSITL